MGKNRFTYFILATLLAIVCLWCPEVEKNHFSQNGIRSVAIEQSLLETSNWDEQDDSLQVHSLRIRKAGVCSVSTKDFYPDLLGLSSHLNKVSIQSREVFVSLAVLCTYRI